MSKGEIENSKNMVNLRICPRVDIRRKKNSIIYLNCPFNTNLSEAVLRTNSPVNTLLPLNTIINTGYCQKVYFIICACWPLLCAVLYHME